MKFAFVDGEKLCVYKDGKVKKFESEYIKRYRENALRTEKNRTWKKSSDQMLYEDYFETAGNNEVFASIHAISPTAEENKIVYAFSVNDTSGVYYKYLDDEKKTEAHILSSNEDNFLSLSTYEDGEMLGTVQSAPDTSSIAVFSKTGGDYKCLTGGDSLDENPVFDRQKNVLFNSYGIGRDANNVFLTYLPSEVYRLNLHTLETELLITDEKYSYVKPMEDKDGNLYCIRKPGYEKERENPLLEILLIPVRIVQAIVGFVSAFVMCFAGKPMVSGEGKIPGQGSAAKNGKGDPKKIFVLNNLINVDKELKKNKKTDEQGFIPRSWKLVRLDPKEDGAFENCAEYELASGVADYVLIEENGVKTLIYTNGKRIFSITDEGAGGKKEKLLETDFCLKVGGLFPSEIAQKDGLFDLL